MKSTTPQETKLKRIRTTKGYSQKQLAELSGVSLRSIQMYEQRNKDINKAQSDSLFRLAKALGCTMEDLLEE
ncbi:MAG: helix-turn-helix domain-containing protein [Clostridia bacterium]|nr:helix-turn-helix domain-containing protein [Clostridia bacterium]